MTTDAEIMALKMKIKTAESEVEQLNKFIVDTKMELKLKEAENEK